MPNKKKSILIVEDEVELRAILKDKLKKEGFVILEAENGKTGLESAIKNHPDVILLDILMPVMDGFSMLKKLRQDEWGKNALIIILSNLSEAQEIDEEIKESTLAYLVKSDWEPDDIVKKILQNLNKGVKLNK